MRRVCCSPLLHRDRFVSGDPEADHLGLRVEAVEVHVRDDPQRARSAVGCHLREMAVGELRSPATGSTRR